VYSKYFWLDQNGNPVNGDSVVVHELAHQWFGDDVALARWQDIWLNEGFATYAEWLWAEHEFGVTPGEIFQEIYDAIPANDPFWTVVIGDPGVDLLFDGAVYVRGAMTLQALRNEVGDDAFWAIIRGWASSKSRSNGTTPNSSRWRSKYPGSNSTIVRGVALHTGEADTPLHVERGAREPACRYLAAGPSAAAASRTLLSSGLRERAAS
jgi:hypothetical protein